MLGGNVKDSLAISDAIARENDTVVSNRARFGLGV